MQLDPATLKNLYTILAEYLVKYGFQVLAGLVILLVGFKLGSWAARFVTHLGEKRKLDVALVHFLAGAARMAVVIFAGLMAVDKFGITISPLIATVSAMIFGASFAIQAPLSNYAAGLSIVLFRPFKVGDTITVQGYNGVVEDVKLPYTVLSTVDGETITIPNKHVVGEVITNSHQNRVAETSIGISYASDPEKAIQAIHQALSRFPHIVTSPGPQVGVRGFADSSIEIGIRYWAPTKEYMKTLQEVNLAVLKAVRQAGLEIPYPQREVRILSPGTFRASS